MRFKNGDRYEGEWKNDDMSGHGFYFWSSGDTFEGEFDCDRRDGDGVLTL